MSVLVAPARGSAQLQARALEDGESFTEQDFQGERRFSSSTRSRSVRCAPTSCSCLSVLGELRSGRDVVRRLLRLDLVPEAFREKLGVSIEQLSDFEPKGAACAAFGVLHAGGFPERALVAIDGPTRRALELSGASPGELPASSYCAKAASPRGVPKEPVDPPAPGAPACR